MGLVTPGEHDTVVVASVVQEHHQPCTATWPTVAGTGLRGRAVQPLDLCVQVPSLGPFSEEDHSPGCSGLREPWGTCCTVNVVSSCSKAPLDVGRVFLVNNRPRDYTGEAEAVHGSPLCFGWQHTQCISGCNTHQAPAGSAPETVSLPCSVSDRLTS